MSMISTMFRRGLVQTPSRSELRNMLSKAKKLIKRLEKGGSLREYKWLAGIE